MRFAVLSLLIALTVGCDQDPFGMSSREIVGPYELQMWEDGVTFYLQGPSNIHNSAHGALEGIVIEIGWNEELILVLQNDDGSGGGWRIIEIESRTVSSIVDEAYIEQRPVLRDLNVYSAAEAWERLR